MGCCASSADAVHNNNNNDNNQHSKSDGELHLSDSKKMTKSSHSSSAKGSGDPNDKSMSNRFGSDTLAGQSEKEGKRLEKHLLGLDEKEDDSDSTEGVPDIEGEGSLFSESAVDDTGTAKSGRSGAGVRLSISNGSSSMGVAGYAGGPVATLDDLTIITKRIREILDTYQGGQNNNNSNSPNNQQQPTSPFQNAVTSSPMNLGGVSGIAASTSAFASGGANLLGQKFNQSDVTELQTLRNILEGFCPAVDKAALMEKVGKKAAAGNPTLVVTDTSESDIALSSQSFSEQEETETDGDDSRAVVVGGEEKDTDDAGTLVRESLLIRQARKESQYRKKKKRDKKNATSSTSATTTTTTKTSPNDNNNNINMKDSSPGVNDEDFADLVRDKEDDLAIQWEKSRMLRRSFQSVWFDNARTPRFQAALLQEWIKAQHEFSDNFYPGEDTKGQLRQLVRVIDATAKNICLPPKEFHDYFTHIGHKHYYLEVGKHHFAALVEILIRVFQHTLGLMFTDAHAEMLDFSLKMVLKDMLRGISLMKRAGESAINFTRRNFKVRVSQWLELLRLYINKNKYSQLGDQGYGNTSYIVGNNNNNNNNNPSAAASPNNNNSNKNQQQHNKSVSSIQATSSSPFLDIPQIGKTTSSVNLPPGSSSVSFVTPPSKTDDPNNNNKTSGGSSDNNSNKQLMNQSSGSSGGSQNPLNIVAGSLMPKATNNDESFRYNTGGIDVNEHGLTGFEASASGFQQSSPSIDSAEPTSQSSNNNSGSDNGNSPRNVNLLQQQKQQQRKQNTSSDNLGGLAAAILAEYETGLMPQSRFVVGTVTWCSEILDAAVPSLYRTGDDDQISRAQHTAAQALGELFTIAAQQSVDAGDPEAYTAACRDHAPALLLFIRRAGDSSISDSEVVQNIVNSINETLTTEKPFHKMIKNWFLNLVQKELTNALSNLCNLHKFAPMTGPLCILELRIEQLPAMLHISPTVVARAIEKLFETTRSLIPKYECAEAQTGIDSLRLVSVYVNNLVSLAVHLLVILSEEYPPIPVQTATKSVLERCRGYGSSFASNNLRPQIGIHWAKPSEVHLESISRSSLFVYGGDSIQHVSRVCNHAAGGQILLSRDANHRLGSEIRNKSDQVTAMTVSTHLPTPMRFRHLERKYIFSVRTPFGAEGAEEKEVVPDMLRDRAFKQSVYTSMGSSSMSSSSIGNV